MLPVLKSLYEKIRKDASLGQSTIFLYINTVAFFTKTPHLGMVSDNLVQLDLNDQGHPSENETVEVTLRVLSVQMKIITVITKIKQQQLAVTSIWEQHIPQKDYTIAALQHRCS